MNGPLETVTANMSNEQQWVSWLFLVLTWLRIFKFSCSYSYLLWSKCIHRCPIKNSLTYVSIKPTYKIRQWSRSSPWVHLPILAWTVFTFEKCSITLLSAWWWWREIGRIRKSWFLGIGDWTCCIHSPSLRTSYPVTREVTLPVGTCEPYLWPKASYLPYTSPWSISKIISILKACSCKMKKQSERSCWRARGCGP